MKRKNYKFIFLIIICLLSTVVSIAFFGKIDPNEIQSWLDALGIWGPVIYILLYTISTLLVLPSTTLNLMGGALFGLWMGTLWTTLAALAAAVVAFGFTRTLGQRQVRDRFSGSWQTLDTELRKGGLFYMAAIRLLPIIPYGLVNYAAGLTSITFRDYIVGTSIGTLPGIIPFVLLGSTGATALKTGEIFPLLSALGLTGLMVGGATWYRRHQQTSNKKNH